MLRTLIAVLCFALAAALLALLAQQRTRAGIDHQAASEFATWAAQRTPWDWRPRQPRDAIAGRAFGPVELHAAAGGLRIDDQRGETYEIGVPLPRTLPLSLLPRLHVASGANRAFELQLSLATTEGAARITSDAIRVDAGEHDTMIDLAALAWHHAGDDAVVAMPQRAWMLRLRIHQPGGGGLTLHALHWRNAADRVPQPAELPVVALPVGAGPEALLALRDRIRVAAPWLTVAATLPVAAAVPLPAPAPLAWSATAAWVILLAALLLARWRGSRRRVLCVAELAAATAPPLAWAIGLHAVDTASPTWLAALAATLAYVLALAWRLYPAQWHFNGSGLTDWLWPLLPVVAAAAWLVAAPVTPQWPSPSHALTYLGWALLQQLLVLAVVATRLAVLLRARFAVALATATLFALVHTPNGLLMLLCLAAGCWWTWHFLRRRALLPVALAHALAALLLESVLPGLPLRSLEIGARFLAGP